MPNWYSTTATWHAGKEHPTNAFFYADSLNASIHLTRLVALSLGAYISISISIFIFIWLYLYESQTKGRV